MSPDYLRFSLAARCGSRLLFYDPLSHVHWMTLQDIRYFKHWKSWFNIRFRGRFVDGYSTNVFVLARVPCRCRKGGISVALAVPHVFHTMITIVNWLTTHNSQRCLIDWIVFLDWRWSLKLFRIISRYTRYRVPRPAVVLTFQSGSITGHGHRPATDNPSLYDFLVKLRKLGVNRHIKSSVPNCLTSDTFIHKSKCELRSDEIISNTSKLSLRNEEVNTC